METVSISESPKTQRLPGFQIVLLVLSAVVLIALLVENTASLPPEISRLVQLLDFAACGLFFIDFCVRFSRAERKMQFMQWGWIDLLACVPNVDFLRVGRMLRVLRIIQLLRGFRISFRLFTILMAGRPRNAMSSVLLMMLLLIASSSMGILICERAPEANIKTAEDAVWWSVTTITTVGYGDKYPTTTEGRTLAMVLMISGVGLFGTLSGIIASLFLARGRDIPSEMELVLGELRELRARLEQGKE